MEEQNTVTTQEAESSQAVDETSTDVSSETESSTTQTSDSKYENVSKALKQARDNEKELKRRIAELEQANSRTLEVDEEGGVDHEQLLNLASERALARMRLEQAEQIDFEEAKNSFPELSSDEDLARAVRAYRREIMADSGEYISYSDAASKLVGKLRKTAEQARIAGQEEVLVSESVQSRAASVVDKPGSGNHEPEADKLRRIMVSDPDPKKRQEARVKLLSGNY